MAVITFDSFLINDPLADPKEARQYYGLELQPLDKIKDMDAVFSQTI